MFELVFDTKWTMSYRTQGGTSAVNIMLMRQAPLVGRAGGISEGRASEGGKKEKKVLLVGSIIQNSVLLCLYSFICCL